MSSIDWDVEKYYIVTPMGFIIKLIITVSSLSFPKTLVGDKISMLTLKVLVRTIDAQWEGMGDVGSVRYKLALLPSCPTIRVLSYSN